MNIREIIKPLTQDPFLGIIDLQMSREQPYIKEVRGQRTQTETHSKSYRLTTTYLKYHSED